MNCNANIHFNKQCLLNKVIPSYTQLRVPHNSPASHVTQQKAQILRIKDEIKFLYRRKDHLNKDLYGIHLQAATEWGTLWDLISTSIHNTTQNLMEKKYTTISHKIKKNNEQNVHTSDRSHIFYPRIMNRTDIMFTPKEETLLQKGLKYNLHHKPKN
jgi:hypothetical protein